jgi:hypothetical protein
MTERLPKNQVIIIVGVIPVTVKNIAPGTIKIAYYHKTNREQVGNNYKAI